MLEFILRLFESSEDETLRSRLASEIEQKGVSRIRIPRGFINEARRIILLGRNYDLDILLEDSQDAFRAGKVPNPSQEWVKYWEDLRHSQEMAQLYHERNDISASQTREPFPPNSPKYLPAYARIKTRE